MVEPPNAARMDVSDTEPRAKRERAEELYAQHLAQLEAGGDSSLDELVSSHPDLSDELIEAHAAWSRASGIYRALLGGDDLSDDALAELVEAGADAAVSLGEDSSALSQDTVSARMMGQLQEHAPRHLRYEVLGEVARGGMGKIMKVWDPDLRRQLAMKVATFPGARGSTRPSEERPLARFLEEAQITGQLDHPCIVPVHELGLDADGRVYFTMQLVRGRDLSRILEHVRKGEDGWSMTRAVRVLLKVAEAMAYAHDKGVLHRDLKPANIMVGRFGEVYVMDWGLARVVGERESRSLAVKSASTSVSFIATDRRDARDAGGEPDASPLHTRDGDVVGTPAYMPPEQARGELDLVDARSDVYSLGAILYHLVAGHMPYVPPDKKRGAYEVWEAVRSGPPEPLGDQAREGPPELVAICDKAMAREPGARYQSMQAVAEDLHAYLDGHVVRAYETGAVAEFRKWVRRNKPTAFASAAAILLALAGLATVSWIQSRSNKELAAKNIELAVARDAAEESARVAQAASLLADQQADLARQSGAEAERQAQEAARERDSADRVVEFLVDLFRSPDPAQARGETIPVKEILDRGAERITAGDELDPLVAARLRDAMGEAYLALGLFPRAEPLLESSYEDRLTGLGPNDRRTLASMNHLASLHVWRGRHADAERLYARALEVEERELPADDPVTLRTLDGMATLFQRMGDLARSEEFRLRSLEGYERSLGPTAPETLESLSRLAYLYRSHDRLDEAEELYRNVLEVRRDELGDDHPDTLRAWHDLGSLLFFRQRYAEARPELERVLAEMRRVLGDEHPETLGCWNDLALMLEQLGEVEVAAETFEHILPGFRKVYGPSHVLTLTVQNNLGVALTKLGRFDEAAALLTGTLALFEERYSAQHRGALGTMNSLGFLHFRRGELEQALTYFEGALAGARELYGDDHPNVRQTEQSVAACYLGLGRYSEALEHALAALEGTPPGAALADRRALVERIRARLRE